MAKKGDCVVDFKDAPQIIEHALPARPKPVKAICAPTHGALSPSGTYIFIKGVRIPIEEIDNELLASKTTPVADTAVENLTDQDSLDYY